MPRFYFHFQDGGVRTADSEGLDLPDAEAAWYHGFRSARDIIRQEMRGGALAPGRCVEIEDEAGRPVWAVRLEEVVGLAY